MKYTELFDILCDLLGLEDTQLIIKEHDKIAEYMTDNDAVVVNVNASKEDIFTAIIHECRHAYQLYEISEANPSKEALGWKNNFDNYINYGKKGYYEQIIELDANAFTLYLLQTIFGVRPWINENFDINKINKCFKEIASEMSVKEINESCIFILGTNFQPGSGEDIGVDVRRS